MMKLLINIAGDIALSWVAVLGIARALALNCQHGFASVCGAVRLLEGGGFEVKNEKTALSFSLQGRGYSTYLCEMSPLDLTQLEWAL